MSRFRSGIAVAALAFVLSVAVAGPAIAATHSVSATDNNGGPPFAFSPKGLTIPVGDSVVWTNIGKAQHTVTADNGGFNSGTLIPGATYSHTFTVPGSYPYHCQFHGAPGGIGMSGTIVVQAAGSSPPSGTAPSSPLPITGPGPWTFTFAWIGLSFLVAGAAVLFALRRRGRV